VVKEEKRLEARKPRGRELDDSEVQRWGTSRCERCPGFCHVAVRTRESFLDEL
jgi:hypothetical protein